MPIYEYQCQKCQTIFEEWQSGFEEREMPCPECGEESKRLISHTSFHLKGSGWYVTDYAGKKPCGDDSVESGDTGDSSDKAVKAEPGGVESVPTPKKESADISSTGSAS
ncbi:MAG: zinc ribbon domain-containing protein [Pseudodesulfovibrio sp.]|nr:zinc ribbon domain-containing protein [Pseudodesulfovibrio sp.]